MRTPQGSAGIAPLAMSENPTYQEVPSPLRYNLPSPYLAPHFDADNIYHDLESYIDHRDSGESYTYEYEDDSEEGLSQESSDGERDEQEEDYGVHTRLPSAFDQQQLPETRATPLSALGPRLPSVRPVSNSMRRTNAKLIRRKTVPRREHSEPNLVTWEGASDPENPHNWPQHQRWTCTVLIAAFAFIAPMASTIIAPALDDIADEFDIQPNSTESFLVMSIFLLAFAIGPFVWGPLSEVFGRVRVMQGANLIFLLFNTVCGFAKTKEQMMAFRFLSGIGGSAPQAVSQGLDTTTKCCVVGRAILTLADRRRYRPRLLQGR